MNIELFRTHCMAKKEVTEEFPFGPDVLVYKVVGKMFALTDVDMFASINLKCDPAVGVEMKERFATVQPAYHMNKKHWVTVLMDDSIPDRQILRWIDTSYDLVVQKLPNRDKKLIRS